MSHEYSWNVNHRRPSASESRHTCFYFSPARFFLGLFFAHPDGNTGYRRCVLVFPIGSMYAIYGNIYHQYTPFMLPYIYISYMDPMGLFIQLCQLCIKRLSCCKNWVLIWSRPKGGVCHGLPGSCEYDVAWMGSCLAAPLKITCFADACTDLYLFKLVVTWLKKPQGSPKETSTKP